MFWICVDWRTSSAEATVPDSENAAVPGVRKPDFGDREGSSCCVRRDLQLDTAECRKVRRVDAGEDIADVDARVRGEVSRRGEGDV